MSQVKQAAVTKQANKVEARQPAQARQGPGVLSLWEQPQAVMRRALNDPRLLTQRDRACLQRTIGNQALERAASNGNALLHAKRAAGLMAETYKQIVNIQRTCACGNQAVLGGECEECKKKQVGSLQRAANLTLYQRLGFRRALPVSQRPYRPTIMRSQLFTSTMEICRRLLESRVFHVSQGGIIVTANASYERRGSPECSQANYHMTLNQKGLIFDSEYGTCEFPQGQPFSRQWTNLPNGDYYLTIWTNNTNPYCCLVGDIIVEQQSGLRGESCTQPPPGPLEILHTALDLAGLVPVLGAAPDAINAGIYVIEGDWLNAGLSAAAIIPLFGEAATVGKIGTRTVVRVTSEGVESVGREGIEAGLREARASQRAASQTVEGATHSTRRFDPEIDEMVEHGIVEEVTSTTTPSRRSRLAAPSARGQAEAARGAFSQVRDDYARRLGVSSGGQVHHAIELQALDRYPGVFSASELNDFRNMRGIGTELANRRQLHNSKVREIWDRHYRQLDREIAQRGLQPGTQSYNDFVRRYMESARNEIDYVLGQFFTEYRSGLNWQRTNP